MQAPLTGKVISNYEPATGKISGSIPDSGERDVDAAVEAARKAFPGWAATSVERRSEILRKISNLILDSLDELARAESFDSGKPLSLARQLDIPRSAKNFAFFADAITQFSSECHVTDMSAVNYTLRQPLGVVACISPWNLPLYLLTWKIAPALASGNCVVAKPSEITPVTAAMLGAIANQAGLPPGVLNIIHGVGANVGPALCGHKDVAAISFTGSTRTGREISKIAAPLFKKLSLEMGGKNPTIIFADCDFDLAVKEVARAAFSNQGQICLCGSRIYIERPLYEKMKRALVDRVSKLRVGDPSEEGTDQGAVVSKQHFEKIMSYLDLAQQEGGKILCGGRRAKVAGRCAEGWFIEPTLIEGLPSDCRVNQEEIFGPVAALIQFDSEKEMINEANSVPYGLSCSLWTRDIQRALRVSREIQTGIVWVNCWMFRDLRTPFGGVKESGVGREGGVDALRFFTEPKNVCLKMEPEA